MNGLTLIIRKVVIAAGVSPSSYPISGLRKIHERSQKPNHSTKHIEVIKKRPFYTIAEIPRRLDVIGTDVVGMEMSQAMQSLGSSETIFERSRR